MHLFIQIPCFNEEKTISKVIKSLPKRLRGIKKISIAILDDGSTDNTVKIVKKNFPYVKICSNVNNQGLAANFRKGIDYALDNKADIIVNIDGDNQYKGKDVERLINPIIYNNFDYVIGERKFNKIKSFSLFKKFLQYSGNFFVRKIVNIETKDATSGFRAYNRKAASKIFYTNNFTYTIESLIHFADSKLLFKSIEIETNKKERESRLFKSNYEYILKTFFIIIKTLTLKKPLQFFSFFSIIFLILGLFFCSEWYLMWIENSKDLSITPRLLLGTTLIILSLQSFTIGIISFFNSINLYTNIEILSKIKIKK